MRNKILLILTLLPLGWGCLADTTTIPNPVESVSVIQPISPTPSNIPTTVISPDNITSSSPSINPEPSPSPIVNVSDSYFKNMNCLSLDKDFKAKLDYPIDLAVTKDGKRVYVVNLRRNLNSFGYGSNLKDANPDNTYILNRQFIYEIKDDKSISALKINDEYPFSCQLSEEIEIDKDDNIFTSKPVIDNNISTNKYLGHEIYKVTPDKQMSLYKKIDLGIPDPSSSARPDPRILTNLHLNDKNELFYLLRSPSVESGDILAKVDIYKDIKQLLSYSLKTGGAITDFAIFNNQIYTYIYKFNVDEIKQSSSTFGSLLEEKGIKIYNGADIVKKYIRTVIDKSGNVYISDNESNVIWKLISDKEIIKFAGSGQAGYKDGLSQEAQFNNPTTMTFDGDGNMFVADSGNNAIRKITPAGIVSTFYKEK